MIGRQSTTGIVFGIALFALCLVGVLVAGFGFGRASPRAEAALLATAHAETLPPRADPAPLAEQPSTSERPQGTTRASVAANAELRDVTPQPGASPTRSVAVGTSLLAEVTALLHSGRIEAHLVASGESLQEFLVGAYLDMGDVQSALDVLQRFPTEDPELYAAVAWALQGAGDSVGATRSFFEVLAREPFNEDVLEALIELDPDGALTFLDGKLAELGVEEAPAMALQRARLLAATGRIEEARAQLDEALATGVVDVECIEIMLEVDPAAAERALRERLSRPQDDESVDYFAIALADLYGGSGRGPEALSLLEGLFARDPAHGGAIEALFAIDPSRAFARLESLPPDELDPSLWVPAGEFLLGEGRLEEAVDAWMRAVGEELYEWEAIEHLRQHAPERLWSHCRDLAERTGDDEVLGDIADLYWEAGRSGEAIELWQRANRIDPGDGEWTGKLQLAEAGGDPLE